MGRRDLVYLSVKGTGGINQQLSLADPEKELADALNVWAPDGYVLQRPGYVGAGVVNFSADATAFNAFDVIVEDPIGTFTNTNTLNSLGAGERWYFVHDYAAVDSDYATGFSVRLVNGNSNEVTAGLEYWNGTTWSLLRMVEINGAGGYSGRDHLKIGATSTSTFYFAWPRDMASTTITATGGNATGYVFRFTVLNGTGTALDSSTSLDTTGHNYNKATDAYVTIARAAFQLASQRLYLYVTASSDGTNSEHNATAYLNSPTANGERVTSTPITYEPRAEPASFAVVPQFNEVYSTHSQIVTAYNPYVALTTTNLVAMVESSPVLVGPGARYDRSGTILQLNAWPQARYILFFRGEMWAANLRGSPYEVRWSAPVPAYKVWPLLNQAYIMENDNSPITGLVGYQEHATVLKSDSIWKMVDTGISDFTLQTYSAVRVVNGIGCASNSSICEIRNRLVFLAEDGIYAYDGTSEVQKLSDRINKYVSRITPGRRPFCVGVNWKSKSLYLLAVSLDGSDVNNYVLVYDYKNDSWWVWNDMEVAAWILDEDSADNEKLYFSDSRGRVYELGSGLTSNGAAISSYVVTQRLAYSHTSKRLRLVSVNSQNISRSATVEVSADDAPFGDSGNQSTTFTYTDSFEKEYGASTSSSTAVYDTDKYTSPRDRVVDEGFLVSGRWFQAKVSHSTKNAKFLMNDLQVGVVQVGRR